MKEISLTSFENLKIGQAENSAAGTGCTVFLLGKSGAPTGLDAAGGVMQYLEEHDIGFDVGVTKVPPVCQADEYSCAVTPQIRQTGNRLSGNAGTAYASLLA